MLFTLSHYWHPRAFFFACSSVYDRRSKCAFDDWCPLRLPSLATALALLAAPEDHQRHVPTTRLHCGDCGLCLDRSVDSSGSLAVRLHMPRFDYQTLTRTNRYYCRYYLVGTVTATDHLMLTALVCCSSLCPEARADSQGSDMG